MCHDILIFDKSSIKWRQHLDMTVAVDWDVKPQIKLTNRCRLSTNSYIPIKLLYFGCKSYIFKHLLYSYKFSYILKIFPIFLGKFVVDE